MPNTDTIVVSFRLPRKLIDALDKIVRKRSPEIKDRTQLVLIALTQVVDLCEIKHIIVESGIQSSVDNKT